MENDQIVAHGESTNDTSHESPTKPQFLGIESAKDENMYIDNNGDNLYIKLSEGVVSLLITLAGEKRCFQAAFLRC